MYEGMSSSHRVKVVESVGKGWVKCESADGQVFYFNLETSETSVKLPVDFGTSPRVAPVAEGNSGHVEGFGGNKVPAQPYSTSLTNPKSVVCNLDEDQAYLNAARESPRPESMPSKAKVKVLENLGGSWLKCQSIRGYNFYFNLDTEQVSMTAPVDLPVASADVTLGTSIATQKAPTTKINQNLRANYVDSLHTRGLVDQSTYELPAELQRQQRGPELSSHMFSERRPDTPEDLESLKCRNPKSICKVARSEDAIGEYHVLQKQMVQLQRAQERRGKQLRRLEVERALRNLPEQQFNEQELQRQEKQHRQQRAQEQRHQQQQREQRQQQRRTQMLLRKHQQQRQQLQRPKSEVLFTPRFAHECVRYHTPPRGR